MTRIQVPGCVATFAETIYEMPDVQILRVEVEPGGEIPMHKHDCAATMIVLSGEAWALGENERKVRKGDIIVKSPMEPHGFRDVRDFFVFISISNGEGIKRGAHWDIDYIG